LASIWLSQKKGQIALRMKVDDPVKKINVRVTPTKVGNHPKDWIPAFAGMTNFAGQNFSKKIIYFSICNSF